MAYHVILVLLMVMAYHVLLVLLVIMAYNVILVLLVIVAYSMSLTADSVFSAVMVVVLPFLPWQQEACIGNAAVYSTVSIMVNFCVTSWRALVDKCVI